MTAKRLTSNPPKIIYDALDTAILAVIEAFQRTHKVRIERLVIDRQGLPGARERPLKVVATNVVTDAWHKANPT